jgi:GDPmannose 4,6-dehydratase
MDSYRDWGHAEDFVEGMWLMLQQEKPDDYVLATGKQHTVREFVVLSFLLMGITVAFENTGVNEIGICKASSNVNVKEGQILIKVNPRYFRPTEVDTLLGNPAKAKKILNWKPKYTFHTMVEDMLKQDIHFIDNNFNYSSNIKMKHNGEK